MKVFLGTTGWAYSFWKGNFYPRNSGYSLSYYSSQSPVVEINSTYYSLPTEQMIKKWEESTSPDFSFFAKMNKEVTHSEKGSGYRINQLTEFIMRFGELSKLRGVLFQFPYSFDRSNRTEGILEEILARYLEMEGKLAIIELRNSSWLNSPVLTKLLDNDQVILASTSKLEKIHELASMQDILYLRLLGSRKEFPDHLLEKKRENKSELLEQWAEKIAEFQGDMVFIFVNNRFSGNAPDDAMKLHRILESKGIEVIGFKPKSSLNDFW